MAIWQCNSYIVLVFIFKLSRFHIFYYLQNLIFKYPPQYEIHNLLIEKKWNIYYLLTLDMDFSTLKFRWARFFPQNDMDSSIETTRIPFPSSSFFKMNKKNPGFWFKHSMLMFVLMLPF